MSLVKSREKTPQQKEITNKSLTVAKQQGTVVRLIGEVDRPFLVIIIALLCIGSVMIFSASYAYAANYFKDSYYFARRQIGWVAFGLVVMGVVAKFVDYRWLKKWALIVYFVALALNFATPFVGFKAGGATRQIDLGFVNFQPSEIMKFAIVLLFAAYISNNQAQIHTFRKGVWPFIAFGLPAAASIIIQKHLSATIIVCMLLLVMMYLSGTRSFWIVSAIAAVIALVIFFTSENGVALLEKYMPHAAQRIKVWEDPFKYMKDPVTQDAGWQPAQSLYAISSGGFWGLGLGKSYEKHGYLPEPQNDYIFAIICEELGFLGALVIILLFAAFAWRGYKIAKNAPNRFTSLLVMGIVAQVVLQVILNIAVVTNTIPSTGISLPFISYGGTSLTILLAEMGIILSISRYSYLEKG